MSDLTHILAIAAGAVPGALSRYQMTEWTKAKFVSNFPLGTLIINLTGCLAVGFFLTIAKGITGYPPELDLLIRTGFLGSYTTFSTYGFETFNLWRNHQRIATVFYGAGSAILGVIGVMMGGAIANLFLGL